MVEVNCSFLRRPIGVTLGILVAFTELRWVRRGSQYSDDGIVMCSNCSELFVGTCQFFECQRFLTRQDVPTATMSSAGMKIEDTEFIYVVEEVHALV